MGRRRAAAHIKVRTRATRARLAVATDGRSVTSQDFEPDSVHTARISRSGLRYRKVRDRIIEALLLAAGLVAVFTTLAIVAILLIESSAFFEHVSIKEFLTDTMWTPLFADAHYGILPLVAGTLTTTMVALLVAVPVGTIDRDLSERVRAAPRARNGQAGAGIARRGAHGGVRLFRADHGDAGAADDLMPELPGFNMLSAGLVIGLMIVPYVSSVSEDAMRAVPRYMREGSYAMGATRLQTALRVVVPGAFSGLGRRIHSRHFTRRR